MQQMTQGLPDCHVDAFNVYISNCATPNDTNHEKLHEFAQIGPNQRLAVNTYLHSPSWEKWRENVAICMKDEVPPLVKDWNVDGIIVVLKRYTDSKHVQARILSMMYTHICAARTSRDLFNSLIAGTTVGDVNVQLLLTICNILSSPVAFKMCASDVYSNVLQVLLNLIRSVIWNKALSIVDDKFDECIAAVYNTCFSILYKIYEVQHTRSLRTGEQVLCRAGDLVGVRRKETCLQIESLDLLATILGTYDDLILTVNVASWPKMRGFLRYNMSRILSLDKLLSENKMINHVMDHRCSSFMTILFISCYAKIFPVAYPEDAELHTGLAYHLQQMGDVILKRAYEERNCPFAYETIDDDLFRFRDIFRIMAKYKQSSKRIALCVVPVLVQCIHAHPKGTLPLRHAFFVLREISNVRGDEFDIAELQQCVATNLIAKYDNKDAIDIVIDLQMTMNIKRLPREASEQQRERGGQLDARHLCRCFDTILRNSTYHNSFLMNMLVETRLFDLLVLALQNATSFRDGNFFILEDPGHILRVILLVLKKKPHQRGRGFIRITIHTQSLGNENDQDRQAVSICVESPGADSTSALSTGMLRQICKRFVNLKEDETLSYEYKVCNIATALTAVMSCDSLELEHREVCFKILALLTETQEEIMPRIGLEWSVSRNAPLGMLDDANKEANTALVGAMFENPMLQEALMRGRLQFSDADWKQMSKDQDLFVPVNSLVYQRGLSGKGTVQINGQFVRPVAPESMQSLLGSGPALIMLKQIWLVAKGSSGEIDVSEEGVLFRSLVFLESMLDQIMDIEYTKNCSSPLLHLILFISRVFKHPCLGTAVKQITCHLLDQLMRKLEIPIYEELSPEPPDLQTSAHMNTLQRTHPVLWNILDIQVNKELFLLLESTPQVTEEECLIVFYACTVLLDIYKIRAVKYSRADCKKVNVALFATWKNIRTNEGFLVEELRKLLTELGTCCKSYSVSTLLRALTWT